MPAIFWMIHAPDHRRSGRICRYPAIELEFDLIKLKQNAVDQPADTIVRSSGVELALSQMVSPTGRPATCF